MLTQQQALRIKRYVESLLVYESQIISATLTLERTNNQAIKELNEYVLKVNQRNAEVTGQDFISYLDNLTEEEACTQHEQK